MPDSQLTQNQRFKDGIAITATHMGVLKCTVKNQKLVHSQAAQPQCLANPLHSTAPSQVHTDLRVTAPMVRRGFLENPSAPKGIRGKDDYVEVSWGEVYQLIDSQHKRIRQRYGKDSIFAGSYGWRSTGSLHQAQPLLQRYMSLAGGYVGHTGDYSTGALQSIMPYVVGSNEVYQQQSTYPNIIEHSEVVVLWGMNPLNTLQVAWTAANDTAFEFYQQLKESNKTIVIIDPMRSRTAEFFDDKATLISPNPMTDVAFMLGIAHTLVKNNWHDTKFINTYTTGYDTFESYLLGDDLVTTDGIAKSASWAADICGIAEEKIEKLAYLFKSHRTILLSGWSMQRQKFGEQPHWMLVTLAAMLGQIGLAGGGFCFNYRLPKSVHPTSLTGLLPSISGLDPLGDTNAAQKTIPVARLVDALESPNKTIQHEGKPLTYPDIKMIWWAGGANFTHHQDTNRLIKAWQKPQFIVVSEPYWTAAAKHADIVLPITTTFERNDITLAGDYPDLQLVSMKQIVPAQALAKSDFEVFSELSELLQKDGRKIFMENKSEMAWVSHFYNQCSEKVDQIFMPFEEFWQKNKPVQLKFREQGQPFIRYQDFRGDPKQHPLNTPSGKIEIYSQAIADFKADPNLKENTKECPPHPTWFSAPSLSSSLGKHPHDKNKQYGEKLHLITPHSHYRLHSQFNYADRKSVERTVAGREPIIIHPADAKKRGIKQGDLVRAFNQQGHILVRAMIDVEIKQGCVCVYQGGWPDLDPINGLCKNGAVNVLTEDTPSSSLSNACVANSTLIEVESLYSNGVTQIMKKITVALCVIIIGFLLLSPQLFYWWGLSYLDEPLQPSEIILTAEQELQAWSAIHQGSTHNLQDLKFQPVSAYGMIGYYYCLAQNGHNASICMKKYPSLRSATFAIRSQVAMQIQGKGSTAWQSAWFSSSVWVTHHWNRHQILATYYEAYTQEFEPEKAFEK